MDYKGIRFDASHIVETASDPSWIVSSGVFFVTENKGKLIDGRK